MARSFGVKQLRDGIGFKIPTTLAMPPWLLDYFGKTGVASILRNIKRQKQADGSQLKPNSPRWRAYKRLMGWNPWNKSLVAGEHRLVKGRQESWTWRTQKRFGGAIVYIGPATPEVRELSRILQEEKHYTGWIGLDQIGRNYIQGAIRSYVKAFFKAAREGRAVTQGDVLFKEQDVQGVAGGGGKTMAKKQPKKQPKKGK